MSGIFSWDRLMFVGSLSECMRKVRRGERIEKIDSALVIGKMYRRKNGAWILA